MNKRELERLRIREAMERVLDTGPKLSSGVTQEALAREAGLKRWYLTHKHPDLWSEFCAQREALGGVPKHEAKLRDEIASLELSLAEMTAKKEELERERDVLRRMNNVLAVENENLRPRRVVGLPQLRED